MPTYDYKCKTCDKVFVLSHSIMDENKKNCPKCGAEMRKLFGNVGASFKGEGFYTTDKFTDR